MFWFSLAELCCSTLVTAQNERLFDVLVKDATDTKGRGKKVFLGNFLDPSSPRLASGLPGPPNCLGLKEPARLGKPISSGLSISSPGRTAIVPNALFPINRNEGGWGSGWTFNIKRILREIREKKKKKEEKNEAEALPNCNYNQLLHRSSFGVLRSSSDYILF